LAVRNSYPQTTRRFTPAHKENKHEAGRAKKFAQAQETKEAPCYEKVCCGEEIKGGGSVKIED
jgi:aspartyl-tRNA synthetase